MEITVEYLDGKKKVFPETSRPGGSYCTSGKAEPGWYVIKDAWGSETIIPADRIRFVKTRATKW